ncbi:MAG: hypothetical protein WD648_01675 [Planctomycetaceae bacterium]
MRSNHQRGQNRVSNVSTLDSTELAEVPQPLPEREGGFDGARGRRGGVLVVAMICLVLISLILSSLLKLSTMHHRQMRYEQQQLQADWLAESGLERAAGRLAADRNYSGETWKVSAADLGQQDGGEVQISLAAVADRPEVRAISVVAIYPSESSQFAQRSHQVTVRINAEP